jgi:ribose 5-phosphate isomerase B
LILRQEIRPGNRKDTSLTLKVKKIGIASDHAGFWYKAEIKKLLIETGYIVKDFGIFEEAPVKDYKFVEDVCLGVIGGEVERGIVICGTGLAVSIAANKVKGIRAALCNDLFTAKKSREHNQSNVLAFGARVIGTDVAKEIVKVWLETDFEGGRHIPRNDFISHLESKY